MKPQAVPVSDISLFKVTSQNIIVSDDMAPDLDPVQEIARFFSKNSNQEPHTSRLQTQTRFVTPLSCDIGPDITNTTSRKMVVSADLDPVYGIAQVFRKPSNHDPHKSRLLTQTRFVTPLSYELEPDITKPTSRNIVFSDDLYPDMSAGLDSGGVIARVFRGPFLAIILKKLTKDER